jgi:hypothetical protein
MVHSVEIHWMNFEGLKMINIIDAKYSQNWIDERKANTRENNDLQKMSESSARSFS